MTPAPAGVIRMPLSPRATAASMAVTWVSVSPSALPAAVVIATLFLPAALAPSCMAMKNGLVLVLVIRVTAISSPPPPSLRWPRQGAAARVTATAGGEGQCSSGREGQYADEASASADRQWVLHRDPLVRYAPPVSDNGVRDIFKPFSGSVSTLVSHGIFYRVRCSWRRRHRCQLHPRSLSSRARATIRDVAALAGVGIKTVSRVINDEANVSPQMRERVQRAVVALNFKPNQGAGALRRGDRKTLTLGLLLDAVDNPFSASINRRSRRSPHNAADGGVRGELRRRSGTRTGDDRRVQPAPGRRADPHHDQRRPRLSAGRTRTGPSVVFVDRPPIGLIADAVLTNNHAGLRQATQHLIDAGHRRIAHLGDELAISTARERRQGFADAMRPPA